MKKLLKFVFFLTFCAISLPLLVTQQAADKEDADVPAEILLESPPVESGRPSFDGQQTVRLLNGGTVRELTLSDYLTGVLAAEMPAGFPEEALKAQAVAARTYTLYKQRLYSGEAAPEAHRGADLCDDPAHCAAFADLAQQASALWGEGAAVYTQRLKDAVAATDGLALIYEDEPIAAVFCAASTGKTESAEDVWSAALPYLISVDSPGGEDCGAYHGEKRISQKDFKAAFTAKWPEMDFSQPPSAWFRDSHRSEAGSVIDVLVGEVRIRGSEVRQTLGLNSANFKVRVEGGDLVFTTVGYGHGVGMSQYGARFLALDGQTYDQILAHYYPGTRLQLQG